MTQQSPSQLLLSPERPGRPLSFGLDLRHLQKLRYLVHRARLADFDGELRVDARGAVLAELRLFNGSGVQHGSVEVSYGATGPPPALYRFSLVAERRLRLRLPVTLAADQMTAELCLRPEDSAEPALCRQLPISRQPLERLHRDTGPDTHLTVDGQTNPINNMERFLRWVQIPYIERCLGWVQASSSGSSSGLKHIGAVLQVGQTPWSGSSGGFQQHGTDPNVGSNSMRFQNVEVSKVGLQLHGIERLIRRVGTSWNRAPAMGSEMF